MESDSCNFSDTGYIYLSGLKGTIQEMSVCKWMLMQDNLES